MIPQEQMDYILETINCPLCGKNNYEPYITNAKELYGGSNNFFTIVQCRDCRMIFTNPRPTKDTIGFFYPDSAGYYQPDSKKNDNAFKEKIIRTILVDYYGYQFKPPLGKFWALLFSKLYWHTLAVAHIPRCIPGGKLLDIGCAWGSYSARMASYGWEVHGIEMNKKAVEYAKNSLGLNNIFNGFFDEYKCPQEFFDVVQMSMAIEHIHQPVECLNSVYKFLKKGGQLIISVPDISGFEARVYGKYAYTLHVPQHLNHFTPATIKLMLNKTGFTVEKIVHQNSAKDLVASAQYLNNKFLHNIFRLSPIRKIFVKPFVFLLSVCGKTSRMSVYARK